MKVKNVVKLGLFGLGVYYLYQNRQDLKKGFQATKANASEGKQAYQKAKDSLANIKHNLAIIGEQMAVVSDITQDLNYQVKTFSTDTQARVAEIQTITNKYQTN